MLLWDSGYRIPTNSTVKPGEKKRLVFDLKNYSAASQYLGDRTGWQCLVLKRQLLIVPLMGSRKRYRILLYELPRSEAGQHILRIQFH
ncbi:hypothetical protein D3C75_1120740 [compost metagenome]